MKVKLYDLLKILSPRSRIKFKVELKNDCFVYEDSLQGFLKSRYYRAYWDEPVSFSLAGGPLNGYIVEITVQGGLPSDL